MKERIMGIEIGEGTIKIIEVLKYKTSLDIKRFALLQTPLGCIEDGHIIKLEPLYGVILKELKDKKYKAGKVVVVIQSSQIVIRTVQMQVYPDHVIRELLSLQTGEYLPVERDDYEIDYKVIKKIIDEVGEKNELLIVAVPKMMVESIVDLMGKIKKKLVNITIPCEALGFVFGESRPIVSESGQNILVIDIGQKNTVVTILVRGQNTLTRTIGFGIKDVSYQVNQIHSVEEMNNFIKRQVEEKVITEINKMLQFYTLSFGQVEFKKVYLIGGGAHIKGMKKVIRESLLVPVEEFHRFNKVIEKSVPTFENNRRFFVNILGAINGM